MTRQCTRPTGTRGGLEACCMAFYYSSKVRQGEDPRRWRGSMHSWAGSHVAKEQFGIQAKSTLAVSGGDLLAQI